MNRTELRRLYEDRARIWDQMLAITAATERRDLTGEENRTWDRLDERLAELSAQIDAAERQADPFSVRAEQASITPEDRRELRIFRDYLRFGTQGLEAEDRKFLAKRRSETRAQSEGTTTAGGYLVPQGYWTRISEVLKQYGGLLGIANVITTATGNPLPWPNNDDTSNVGSVLGENTQVSEVDLTIGERILNAYTYTSNLVLISLQLMQDSAFDLDEWVPKKLGQRLGRGVAADLVNGNGSSKPIGLAYSPNVGVTGANGQTTSVIYDNLVDLEHSVDAAYRQLGNCRFLMNDLSVSVIRKLKDEYGHPLWQPSVAIGNPSTLLGYPVTVDNAVPEMGASAASIAFGDFELGYVVRQVLDMQVLRLEERYADYLQVGILGFLRIDGRPDDASAVKWYENSAT